MIECIQRLITNFVERVGTQGAAKESLGTVPVSFNSRESSAVTMKIAILVLALLVGVIALCCAIWACQETKIRVSNSPDGRYVLAVTKRNLDTLTVMPGQGSDIKCFVKLRRRGDGRMILRKGVNMLQDVEHIQWGVDRVWINSRCAISYDGKVIGNWQ